MKDVLLKSLQQIGEKLINMSSVRYPIKYLVWNQIFKIIG